MNRVLQIPTQVVKQKCLSEGPERHFFLILLLKVIRLGFTACGVTSLPPRAILRPKSSTRYALMLLLYTTSALEQARLAGYKTTAPDFRQALLFGRVSVGNGKYEGG